MQSTNASLLADLPTQPIATDWQSFLQKVLAAFDCTTGTLHRLDPADGMLKLVTSERIPEHLMGVISVIPVGKGIAGAAAQRREPVEICNLQTDTTGVARPDAKTTGVQGNIAVPIQDGERLCGTLGIGKFQPYDFTDAEKAQLLELTEAIAARL